MGTLKEKKKENKEKKEKVDKKRGKEKKKDGGKKEVTPILKEEDDEVEGGATDLPPGWLEMPSPAGHLSPHLLFIPPTTHPMHRGSATNSQLSKPQNSTNPSRGRWCVLLQ